MTNTDNPVDEEAISVDEEAIAVEVQPPETNHGTSFSFTATFLQEGVIMPGSALRFIITALLGFAGIKSQGRDEFPFQTHPQAIMVAITSLIMYALASAAEHVISATRLGPTSVYAITFRLGMMGSLCILVGSLASLFYS